MTQWRDLLSAHDWMSEQYHLDTPEAVALAYDVAGLGTRSVAALIDLIIGGALGIVILIGTYGVAFLGDPVSTVATILGLIMLFLLVWGYYIIFETLWSGQTPGKRAMKIRVIKNSGYPIGFVDAVIRNLVRVIDFLPTMYAIGTLTMFISPESRRLGDYAAGTLVVKERAPVSLRDFDAAVQRIDRWSSALPASQAADLGAVNPDEHNWDLRALAAPDLQLIGELLDRAPKLRPDARTRLANEIATAVAERIGAEPPLDALTFLERVLFLSYS